jgi:hypothetical protein
LDQVTIGSLKKLTDTNKRYIVPGTTLYFAIYELTKRTLTEANVPEVVSHLTAGALGDLTASFIYVPSEVLKTRLQLQGRYNNPHFVSGYNYKNTWHATKMVKKKDSNQLA